MKTCKAAICEDEQRILDYLMKKLPLEMRNAGLPMEFTGFTSGLPLLESISSGDAYDILFLDIEMPDMNGIEVCRKIRAVNADVLIIFISNKEELVFQTFEVRPFRFVRKSHFREELPSLIADIKGEFDRQKGYILTIRENGSSQIYQLSLNALLYVEVIGKYCDFHMTDRKVTVRYTITQLEDELTKYGFLRPHRSYLVNYRYIYNIGGHSITLDNHEEIPISRRRVDEIKDAFLALSRSEL